MFTPNLSLGGAERWVVSLIKHSDPTRIKWDGIIISGWGGLDPSLCAEVSKYCPIVSERKISRTLKKRLPTPAAASPNCEQYITRFPSLKKAVTTIGMHSDVMIAWGSPSYLSFLTKGIGPQEMVLVSHSSHHKVMEIERPRYFKRHLVAVSERAAKQFNPLDGQEIEVIYNGAQVDRLQATRGREQQRAAWGVEDHHNVVGYIGRFTAEKNPAAAALAIQCLDPEKWRAVYYGTMPVGQRNPSKEEQEVMKWAKDHSPLIQFHSPTQEVGNVYSGIDVLMLASNSEACSLTLLEAFYCGVPVVATPVGSVPEFQKKFGKLVIEVPCNPTKEQLAAACKRAVSIEGIEVASAARKLAREQFTAESMADRWATYLDSTIQYRVVKDMVLDL